MFDPLITWTTCQPPRWLGTVKVVLIAPLVINAVLIARDWGVQQVLPDGQLIRLPTTLDQSMDAVPVTESPVTDRATGVPAAPLFGVSVPTALLVGSVLP